VPLSALVELEHPQILRLLYLRHFLEMPVIHLQLLLYNQLHHCTKLTHTSIKLMLLVLSLTHGRSNFWIWYRY